MSSWCDAGAALAVFFLLVFSTFPLVLPFLVVHEMQEMPPLR